MNLLSHLKSNHNNQCLAAGVVHILVTGTLIFFAPWTFSFLILNYVQSTWTILSNHLLQLLYSVPSPCKHCLAVTEEVGISITLGDWVECGGGWSKQRRKIAFSTASRLALFWRSMNLSDVIRDNIESLLSAYILYDILLFSFNLTF